MEFNFRPLAQTDFPQMHIWLNTDFIMAWYGKKPVSIEEVENKYTPYITGDKPTKAFIIMVDKTAIGYIQTYLITNYPEYNQFVGAAPHTAGVDLFIGHSAYIHKGYGAELLKAFIKAYVFSPAAPEVKHCIIGPEPANRAAIRMYEKAGFRWFKDIHVPGEDMPEYLMELYRETN